MRSPLLSALLLGLTACEAPPRVIADPFPQLPDPDVSRMLLFRESQLQDLQLAPTAAELRAHLVEPDRQGQGQALRAGPGGPFDSRSRRLEAWFAPGATSAELVARLNTAAAQLPEPRSFTEGELLERSSGVPPLSLGWSSPDEAGGLSWEWTFFDPGALPDPALVELVGLIAPAVSLTLGEEFLRENLEEDGLPLRLSAWAASMDLPSAEALSALPVEQRLEALLPPFARTRVNRWPAIPSANCMQTANLILYPQLNRYPFFSFDPMMYLGDIAQTQWREEMEAAGVGMQLEEVDDTIRWIHEELGATGDVDLFELGAPLQTGTVVVWGLVGFHGFLNLGHAATVLGAIVEGEGEGLVVRDYLVIEKENPGLHPIRIQRLSRVVSRLEALGGAYAPGGGIRLFAYTPEGDPLPFAEVDPALLHPDR